jgi:hypothetical protein
LQGCDATWLRRNQTVPHLVGDRDLPIGPRTDDRQCPAARRRGAGSSRQRRARQKAVECDFDLVSVPCQFNWHQEAGKLDKLGPFPGSYQGLSSFPAHPDLGPTWNIRAAVIILLPEKK